MMTEKKITEITDKVNRGISAASIIKDISTSSEITKKLEVCDICLVYANLVFY